MRDLRALVLAACLTLAAEPSFAAQSTGTVETLEIWSNGNVAFRLTPAVSTCNQQFILNASSPGTKNLYAALLAAKTTGRQVRVVDAGVCGAAEGYGSSYNLVIYLYVEN